MLPKLMLPTGVCSRGDPAWHPSMTIALGQLLEVIKVFGSAAGLLVGF